MVRENPAANDGRHLRVLRGKDAAIDALVEIYTEGRPYPTFADIAERAGISERTLFRYFGSYDEFITEAVQKVYPRVQEYFTPIAVTGDLRTRLLALVELRSQFVRKYGAMVRSVDVLAAEWKAAKTITAQREELLAKQLDAWLGADRDSIPEESMTVLNYLLGWQSTEHMVTTLGKRTPEVLVSAAMAIIKSAGK